MSLDVYLLSRADEETPSFNLYEVRHLAVNYAITCMKNYSGTFTEWYEHLHTEWRDIANKDNPDYEPSPFVLYDSNITHNLAIMADKAGIYKHLWRPEELGITKAKELIIPLEKGLNDLKERPDYFKQFDAENGWGRYIDFVPFVEDYLKACKKYPDSIIRVSR